MKNKNQKRIRNRAWAWIVTAGLTIGSLTGCGSQTVEQTAQGEKTDGEVTITIWHDKEDAVTQVLEEEFTQLEPQIHVVLEKKSDLTEALKMVGNDPKAAPDHVLNIPPCRFALPWSSRIILCRGNRSFLRKGIHRGRSFPMWIYHTPLRR